MYSVYILYSEKHNKFYVGHTDNPERRLEEHNNSLHNNFTSKNRPWQIVFSIQVAEIRRDAMRVEKYIKNQKSVSFIKKIIEHKNNPEFLAQLVRVPFERD